MEILACPVDSPLRRDAEVCACGAQRVVDQAGARFAVTGPWANQEDLLRDVSAAEISRLLGVSRNTMYRYLGPGWKRRTKAEAHQPAAGVADAAGHDLTDQPARLDRGP